MPLAREAVDLGPLLAETAEDAEMLASPSEVTVRTSLTPAVTVSGDPVLIRRAVLNLVDNAVRYNRPGGEISLTLRREGPGALVVISNTGPGIPAHRHADLFQRFFRVADDRNRRAGGSGLGLSLAREIAVAHGGDLVLSRSGPDATEFTLRLPAA
jgi:signal transduction histidine kinase